MSCTNFKTLMNWQYNLLREHISKNKYYLGEKGIYVSFEEAEADFLVEHFERVASEMRKEFCTSICPVKTCLVRDVLVK
jgi:hypothetical protein